MKKLLLAALSCLPLLSVARAADDGMKPHGDAMKSDGAMKSATGKHSDQTMNPKGAHTKKKAGDSMAHGTSDDGMAKHEGKKM